MKNIHLLKNNFSNVQNKLDLQIKFLMMYYQHVLVIAYLEYLGLLTIHVETNCRVT